MCIKVNNLAKASGYNLKYFQKLLRENGISNRIVLDMRDVKKLHKNISAVNNKSYVLLIELDKIINQNSKKAVK